MKKILLIIVSCLSLLLLSGCPQAATNSGTNTGGDAGGGEDEVQFRVDYDIRSKAELYKEDNFYSKYPKNVAFKKDNYYIVFGNREDREDQYGLQLAYKIILIYNLNDSNLEESNLPFYRYNPDTTDYEVIKGTKPWCIFFGFKGEYSRDHNYHLQIVLKPKYQTPLIKPSGEEALRDRSADISWLIENPWYDGINDFRKYSTSFGAEIELINGTAENGYLLQIDSYTQDSISLYYNTLGLPAGDYVKTTWKEAEDLFNDFLNIQ